MVTVLNNDIFTVIVSFIHDTETLFILARSFRSSHPLIDTILLQICQLPIPVSFSEGTFDVDSLIDLLEHSACNGSRFPLAGLIRHLILDTPAGRQPTEEGEWRPRITRLLGMLKNLRVLDWHGWGGPLNEDVKIIGNMQTLQTVHIDWGYASSDYGWAEGAFAAKIMARLKTLDLRKVSLVAYNRLHAQKSTFSTYTARTHLALDLTDGAWDWNGLGIPQRGASERFIFENLEFPAVKQLEMRVGDLTIAGERMGPMDLVTTKQLESLSLFVDPWYATPSMFMLLLLGLILSVLPQVYTRSRNGQFAFSSALIQEISRPLPDCKFKTRHAMPLHGPGPMKVSDLMFGRNLGDAIGASSGNSAIFASNSKIRRVGVGHSVWERTNTVLEGSLSEHLDTPHLLPEASYLDSSTLESYYCMVMNIKL
ncbi:hypothetical protein H0H87_003675 [Tephrocybe sp. NHM501043]|nr:hypothetical protein H0H87_003675 [Tephrocybe sp. NHM501043]